MPLTLEIIILAAGCSSRLGQPKQLVKFHGESLLARQARLALELVFSSKGVNVTCVLGFEAQMIKRQIDDLPVKYLVNKNWQLGLASSIAFGVNQASAQTDAVMLLLGDQWQLTEHDLQQLISCWQKNSNAIVCAQQVAQSSALFGPPAIFPRRYFSALTALTQGQGAKSVIVENVQQTIFVPLANAFSDLDTPEHLAELRGFEHNN